MLPSKASDRVVERHLGDTDLFGQMANRDAASRVSRSRSSDDILSQNCERVGISARDTVWHRLGAVAITASEALRLGLGPCTTFVPTFLDHVRCVISNGAREQVVGSNTSDRAAVTLVEHTRLVGRQFAIGQDVSDDAGDVSPSTEMDLASPVRVARSSPDPAWTEFGTVLRSGAVAVNLLPEAILNRPLRHTALRSPTALQRAIQTSPDCYAVRSYHEGSSTNRALARDGTLVRHHDLLTRCRGVRPVGIASTCGPTRVNCTRSIRVEAA